jgi:hypothetical protein
MQASQKLDEVTAALAYIANDLKKTLDADNAELRVIREEIAALREAVAAKGVTTKKTEK